MRYQVGDLVTNREEENVGIVIDVEKANSTSLMTSSHSQHLLKNSTDIYYVFFPKAGITGPYYTSELKLKRSSSEVADS